MSLLKKCSAIIIAAALLFTVVAPPFAEAATYRSADNHQLRKALQSMDQKRVENRLKAIAPSETKQTYERGIEFFQRLFKRVDTPKWMEALVHILYAPLSSETWRLEAFRVKEFIEDHHPQNLRELRELEQNVIALFSTMGISHILLTQAFYHLFIEIYQPNFSIGIIAISLAAFFVSAVISLIPTQILAHSGINGYSLLTGRRTLTKKHIQIEEEDELKRRLKIKLSILNRIEPLLKGLSDSDPDVRAQSAEALKALTDAGLLTLEMVKNFNVAQSLLKGLSDSESRVRAQSAAALKALMRSQLVNIISDSEVESHYQNLDLFSRDTQELLIKTRFYCMDSQYESIDWNNLREKFFVDLDSCHLFKLSPEKYAHVSRPT